MADASRFPQLAYPFALAGAAAGWLSAGFVDTPLIGYGVSQPTAALCAAVVGGLTGALLKRLCVGGRYRYEIGEPDPSIRPWTDTWTLQGALVLAAGAATGALIPVVSRDRGPMLEWVIGGMACALVFVPACLLVIAAGRRAQRARLGSLVAACDRRAVWGILAILLAGTTLEALPEWPVWGTGEGNAPVAVPVVLLAALTATFAIRASDRRAAARARAVIEAGLSEREARDDAPGDRHALDLGLGDQTLGRVVRGTAAYRQRERLTALVKGSPELALATLERAIERGTFGLAAIGAVAAVHVGATTRPALMLYQEDRCSHWHPDACAAAAALLDGRDPQRAKALLARARRN